MSDRIESKTDLLIDVLSQCRAWDILWVFVLTAALLLPVSGGLSSSLDYTNTGYIQGSAQVGSGSVVFSPCESNERWLFAGSLPPDDRIRSDPQRILSPSFSAYSSTREYAYDTVDTLSSSTLPVVKDVADQNEYPNTIRQSLSGTPPDTLTRYRISFYGEATPLGRYGEYRRFDRVARIDSVELVATESSACPTGFWSYALDRARSLMGASSG